MEILRKQSSIEVKATIELDTIRQLVLDAAFAGLNSLLIRLNEAI
jgi:hypothetical protein